MIGRQAAPRGFYHYTCFGHGYAGILAARQVLPAHHPAIGHQLAWFTDLPEPARDGLGLTSERLRCDRTAVRFEVDPAGLVWWPTWARRAKVGRSLREGLESFGMPAHWWVSEDPVPVVGEPLVRVSELRSGVL